MKNFLNKGKKELQQLLNSNREKLRSLRFELAVGKIKSVRKIRETRKDIARILTIINSNLKKFK